MATYSFDELLDSEQYFLSSMLSSVMAMTEETKIFVSLTSAGENDTFFSTYLYAYNGVVVLEDVGALIEEYFRRRHKVSDLITLTFGNQSVDVNVMYCEYSLPDDFNPQSAFLVAASAQQVFHESVVAIAVADTSMDSEFTIRVAGHDSDDDIITVISKKMSAVFNQEKTAYFNVYDIIEWALAPADGDDDHTQLRDVICFSLEFAGIQKTCFLASSSAYLTFSFRNIFNVKEYIDVAGVMTRKTEVSRDTAICAGNARQYDRAVSRSYEVQSAPVPAEQIAIWEQFVASNELTLILGGKEYEAIISEHTCEPSTDDENLCVVKFSWRFAHVRPRLFDSSMDGVMPQRRSVFNDSFSAEYE